MQIKYKRILLKFSGEALSGDNRTWIEPSIVNSLVSEIAQLIKLQVQIGLVVGGGNFFRGNNIAKNGLVEQITADQMGMLATIINALAIRDAFEHIAVQSVIMSAVPILGMVDFYNKQKAIEHLKNNKVVIFAAGTGNPLVTTDSAASLRAIELEAEVLLKATQVDGIYPADPKNNGSLKPYKKISYKEVLAKELAVMDLNAFIQCRDHNMKIVVFNINKPHSLLNIIYGKEEGTLVEGDL